MTKKKEPPVAPKLSTITAFDQITPAAAVELYKKHGLKVRTRALFPSTHGCCIMGAVLVEMGHPIADASAPLASSLDFDHTVYDPFMKLFPDPARILFEQGFDHGVDHVDAGEPEGREAGFLNGRSSFYKAGWDVGLACARAQRLGEI